MFSHCNRNFKPNEIWFLFDNEAFDNRKLELGFCPICENAIAELTETRIADGKIFKEFFSKKQVEKIISLLINQVDYTDFNAKKIKQNPCGFIFGENKEIRKNGKIVEIRQKACDFYGNKKVISHSFPSPPPILD